MGRDAGLASAHEGELRRELDRLAAACRVRDRGRRDPRRVVAPRARARAAMARGVRARAAATRIRRARDRAGLRAASRADRGRGLHRRAVDGAFDDVHARGVAGVGARARRIARGLALRDDASVRRGDGRAGVRVDAAVRARARRGRTRRAHARGADAHAAVLGAGARARGARARDRALPAVAGDEPLDPLAARQSRRAGRLGRLPRQASRASRSTVRGSRKSRCLQRCSRSASR